MRGKGKAVVALLRPLQRNIAHVAHCVHAELSSSSSFNERLGDMATWSARARGRTERSPRHRAAHKGGGGAMPADVGATSPCSLGPENNGAIDGDDDDDSRGISSCLLMELCGRDGRTTSATLASQKNDWWTSQKGLIIEIGMIKLISQKFSLDVGSMDKSISIVTCLAHYESLFQANFALMWKNHY